ncbi:hypothetical protein G7Y89_g15087 [Cudoniella acicularis]|uniref:Uncharacterized protein n=1 Tax=Cudoniella acicularis TaxID=354080 RepID=A0A8H4QVF8_9HELO|nr:hypothetical protein G7Y89_g15087 [Cudoniella acicularis]
MASHEMKTFASSLSQLSNCAIGLMKATDRRDVENRHKIDELNAIVASKHQIISRQRQIINTIGKKYAALEREMKMAQEELRAYKEMSPSFSARTESMSSASVYTTTTEEHVMESTEKSIETMNNLNLPSLKDILDRIDTNYGGNVPPRTSSRTPPSTPYSGSQLKGLAISELGIPQMLPHNAQPPTPVACSNDSPVKRRRVTAWSPTDDEDPGFSHRQKSPKTV